MKRLRYLILAFLITLPLGAKPGRAGKVTVYQPDGSSFTMLSYGDEFIRVRKTEDGHAVIKGEDGWWYYAAADILGNRWSTGCRIGKDASESALSASLAAAQITPRSSRIRREAFNALQEERLAEQQKRARMAEEKGSNAFRGIVILAAFKDVSFTYKQQEFIELLNKKGYSRNGASGSAKDYFEEQFGEGYSFDFDVSNIVTLSKVRSYYGKNTSNGDDAAPAEMVAEACRLASQNGVDFSQYDHDGDGEVDNIFVFYAGEDESDYPEGSKDDCIWAHAWYVKDGAGIRLSLNGKVINRYACASETTPYGNGTTITSIGTFCHEFTHTLGLPDFYDTDYEESGGMSAALWSYTSLMDSGCRNNNGNTPPYFNAIEREMLGLCEILKVSGNGYYTLSPIGSGASAIRIDCEVEDEYYLLECRSQEGWDKHLNGNGMLVYHIDKSKNPSGKSDEYGNLSAKERWDWYNAVNTYPQHQCADLVEADGRKDSFSSFYSYSESLYSNSQDIFFPAKKASGKTVDLRSWTGTKIPPCISEVTRSGNDIRFRLSRMSGSLSKPELIKTDIFQDAAIIVFSCDPNEWSGSAMVRWLSGGKEKSVSVEQYESGQYCATIDGLQPDNEYEISLALGNKGALGDITNVSIKTKKYDTSGFPYICLDGVDRENDGSFSKISKLPLRLDNAIGAINIRWFFNGKEIRTGADGYYHISTNGELKAELIWEDSSRDIIRKSIIVR